MTDEGNFVETCRLAVYTIKLEYISEYMAE